MRDSSLTVPSGVYGIGWTSRLRRSRTAAAHPLIRPMLPDDELADGVEDDAPHQLEIDEPDENADR